MPGVDDGDPVEVDVVGERHRARVDLEDLAAADLVGRVDRHAAVEAPGAQQRRVEDLGAVGRREHDDALRAGEAVHLGEDLVERLLALVVAAEAAAAAAARAADGVELVDEDDRRRGLLGLLEEVAHAAGADADDHLDELRRLRREERHVGLAGDRAREQRLARARRAGQQHALGDRGAERGTCRGSSGSRRSRRAPPRPRRCRRRPRSVTRVAGRVVALGLRAPERRCAPAAGHARAAAQEVDEQADDQQRRAEGDQQRRQERAALVDRPRVDLDLLVEQQLEQLVVLGERRADGLEARLGPFFSNFVCLELALDDVVARVDLLDVARRDLRAEERVRDVDALVLAGRDQLRR